MMYDYSKTSALVRTLATHRIDYQKIYNYFQQEWLHV